VRTVHLLGGGWDPAAAPALYGPFLDAAGTAPAVAVVVLDEGDGTAQFGRWAGVLTRTARCEPVPVLVPAGGRLDPAALGDADALLVCGGLTPAYAAALAPAAGAVRGWLAERDRPCAGFSAGAAVAAGDAVVGGWRSRGVAVCPEDAAEDLDEVAVVPGLGLVPWTVDVHCAQWGTLPPLLTARTGRRWWPGGAPPGTSPGEGVPPPRSPRCGPGRACPSASRRRRRAAPTGSPARARGRPTACRCSWATPS
jgi:cyanophycinase